MTSDIEMATLKVPGSVTLGGTLHLAAMPAKWSSTFESIWPSRKPRERAIPYGSLGDALRMLFPGIAFIEPMNTNRMTQNWLASWDMPSPEPFISLIKAWARSEGGDRASAEIIEQIRWQDLNWAEQKLTFGYGANENGTPDLNSTLYNALPALLCAELASKSIEVAGRSIRFRRTFAGRSSSLVSWPPEDDGWSYVITPRLLTMAGCSDLFLSLRSSIRRWEKTPLESKSGFNRLSATNDTSAYIEIPDPWFASPSQSHEHSLVTIPMRLRRGELDGEQVWQPAWSNKVEQVLGRTAIDPGLPTAVELSRNPELFLNRELGKIGITVPSGSTNHRVTTGVPLPDRRDIFDGLAAHLKVWGFRRSEPLRRVSLSAARKSPLRSLKYSNMPGGEIVGSIQQSLRKDQLRFEILFQTEVARAALRKEIWNRLLEGGDAHEPDSDRAIIAGVEVEIICRPLGALGSSLPDSSRGSEERRIEEIKKDLHLSSDPIACLVELQDAEYFKRRRGHDPKSALRRGLAETSRLSQFIVPPSDESEMDGNRVASAVADLLRQLGALPGAPFDRMPKTANLPADMQALGVWICGNNLPMLVHLASQEQIDDGVRRLQIMLPVGVRGGEWHSYPEALLKMSQNEIDGVARNQVRGVLRNMLRVFADGQKVRDVPILMLCDAVNIRKAWKELNNNSLVFEHREEVPWNIGGLRPRVVRVCDSGNQVPQWFDSSLQWRSGLFESGGGHTYLSLAEKPVTLKASNPRKSKREAPFDFHAFTDWKEIVLAQLHDNDRPDSWAYVVHRLRDMAAHYDESLILPLPLYLARIAEEYLPYTSKRSGRRM